MASKINCGIKGKFTQGSKAGGKKVDMETCDRSRRVGCSGERQPQKWDAIRLSPKLSVGLHLDILGRLPGAVFSPDDRINLISMLKRFEPEEVV